MTSDTDAEDYLERRSFQKLVAHLSTQALESPHANKHAAGIFGKLNKAPIVMANNQPRTCFQGNCDRPSGHAEFVACWQGIRQLQVGQRPRQHCPVDIASTGHWVLGCLTVS